MEAKSFLRSKTFWFNVLALVMLVATGFGYGEFQADPAITQYGAVVITVINLILRFATRQPVQ